MFKLPVIRSPGMIIMVIGMIICNNIHRVIIDDSSMYDVLNIFKLSVIKQNLAKYKVLWNWRTRYAKNGIDWILSPILGIFRVWPWMRPKWWTWAHGLCSLWGRFLGVPGCHPHLVGLICSLSEMKIHFFKGQLKFCLWLNQLPQLLHPGSLVSEIVWKHQAPMAPNPRFSLIFPSNPTIFRQPPPLRQLGVSSLNLRMGLLQSQPRATWPAAGHAAKKMLRGFGENLELLWTLLGGYPP